MKYIGMIAAILFLFAAGVHAQTVQLMPTPRQTFLSNTGAIIPGAALYAYNAGTTTAAATYTDSTGTVLNTNPVIADGFGRFGQIWLLNQSYKFIMCVQNDGAACASGDILWSVDNVPGFGAGGTGSSASPFISASSNPAHTGILRLATGDPVAWRNAGNSADISLYTKGANNTGSGDILTWNGINMQFVTGACASGGIAVDLLCAGATRWQMSNAGGALVNVVASGADINTSDQVTSTHLSSALPTAQGGTGQTTLTGLPITNAALTTPQIGGTTITNVPNMAWSSAACMLGECTNSQGINVALGLMDTNGGGIVIENFRLAQAPFASGCTGYPTFVIYDETAASAVSGASITLTSATGTYAATVNQNVPANHVLDMRKTVLETGCTNGGVITMTATYRMQ